MLSIKRLVLSGLLVSAALTFVFSFAVAEDQDMKTKDKNPYLQPDETWISISGKAVSADVDSFLLDYGKGIVTVEMDDWDWYQEGHKIIEDHKVTVYGKIDDDMFETTTIEASSVYDENLGTYFYASAADVEYDDDYDYWVSFVPVTIPRTVVRGTVTSINGRKFTINTGSRKITVDTSTMLYNPMDGAGFQRVDKGDYVSVSGNMEDNFWQERKLMADAVVTLYDD